MTKADVGRADVDGADVESYGGRQNPMLRRQVSHYIIRNSAGEGVLESFLILFVTVTDLLTGAGVC